MPYSPSDSNLPDYVKKLSLKRRRQWCDVWNSAYQRTKKAGKSDKDAESAAFAQANGVVGAKASLSAGEPVAPVSVAAFALDLEPFDAGDIIYRPGLLFKAGDYPDKAFSMTPDELRAAAEAFSGPVLVDLEHIDTPLSGKLGEVVHVEASDDGQELHGIVALPKWLDGVLDERRVSATWDRQTKTLQGLALVLNPRVDEAALMAAFSAAGGKMPMNVDMSKLTQEERDKLPVSDFGDPKRRLYPIVDQDDVDSAASLIGKAQDPDAVKQRIIAIAKRKRLSIPDAWKSNSADHSIDIPLDLMENMIVFAAARHDTPQGRLILQELHDTSARGGAVCKASNTVPMASSHENSAIQKIHDMATEHGAKCAKLSEGRLLNVPPYFSGDGRRTTSKEGSPLMNAWDWLKSKLEGEPAPEGADTTASGSATMSTGQNAEFESLKRRQAELETENRRIRAERIREQAVQFADTQMREQRAYPAEREAIIADYVQRATDDQVLEPQTVTFKDAQGNEQTRKISRLEMLQATFAARPQHGLSREQLETEGLSVLLNQSQTDSKDREKPADEKRVAELVAATSFGRAVFSRKNGSTN